MRSIEEIQADISAKKRAIASSIVESEITGHSRLQRRSVREEREALAVFEAELADAQAAQFGQKRVRQIRLVSGPGF